MILSCLTYLFPSNEQASSDAGRAADSGGPTTSGQTSSMVNSPNPRSRPSSNSIPLLGTGNARYLIFLMDITLAVWSLIAAQLPGRTDNDVKNHWNTKLKKKLSGMGIDPVTHKPFSHLMAEIATTLAPPQVAHLAEAALGCFKDEMLHLLTKKRIDFAGPATPAIGGDPRVPYNADANPNDDKEDAVQKIKLGLSRAIMQEPNNSKAWAMMSPTGEPSDGLAGMCDMYPTMGDGFRYSGTAYGNDADGSAWSQSLCTGSTCTGGAAEQKGGGMHEKEDDDDGEEAEGGKAARRGDTGMFGSDCVLWDLSDDLMNPIV